jgi:hypothetical protein
MNVKIYRRWIRGRNNIHWVVQFHKNRKGSPPHLTPHTSNPNQQPKSTAQTSNPHGQPTPTPHTNNRYQLHTNNQHQHPTPTTHTNAHANSSPQGQNKEQRRESTGSTTKAGIKKHLEPKPPTTHANALTNIIRAIGLALPEIHLL